MFDVKKDNVDKTFLLLNNYNADGSYIGLILIHRYCSDIGVECRMIDS